MFNLKFKLISAAAFLFIIMSGIITHQCSRINNLQSDNTQLTQIAQDSGRVAKQFRDENGQLHSENRILTVSVRTLNKVKDNQEFAFLKQFEGKKKNNKNLEEGIKIKASIDKELKLKTGTLSSTSVGTNNLQQSHSQVDSVNARSFSYVDEWNSIKGVSRPDTTLLDINIQVPIDGVIYWKRKRHFIFKSWRWGKKEYFSEFTSANRFVELKDHEVMRVEKR